MSLEILLKVILLGIVEGITEFLPISSTGHLIVFTSLLAYPPIGAFRDTFDIFIQLGAILAVVVYYARDLLQMAQKLPSDKPTQQFWLNVIVAFIPAFVIGFLFRHQIKDVLFNPVVVAISLIVGGIIFLVIEQRPRKVDTTQLEKVSLKQAVIVGLSQILALIPGVSRSGATIVGGMLSGMDRVVATKFTFYLSIPTLGIATVYELFSAIKDGTVTGSDLPVFALGTVVAFVVAWASIAWLLRYVSSHDFKNFGYYRILAGVVILVLAAAKLLVW